MNTSTSRTDRAWPLKIAIGVLAAIALHFTLYFVGSVVTGIWEEEHGAPAVYGNSPVWVLLWGGALAFLLWKYKPRLFELTIPFTLWTGFWFLEMIGTNFHPDTAEQTELATFSQAMFLACFCIWGLALLLTLVRWVFVRLSK